MRATASSSPASSSPSDSLDDVAGCSRSARMPDIHECRCLHAQAVHPLLRMVLQHTLCTTIRSSCPSNQHTPPAYNLWLASTRTGHVHPCFNKDRYPPMGAELSPVLPQDQHCQATRRAVAPFSAASVSASMSEGASPARRSRRRTRCSRAGAAASSCSHTCRMRAGLSVRATGRPAQPSPQ